jgi:hypothetical protein
VESGSVIAEIDDEHEQRVRLVFQPYQAVRLTTADCFVLPDEIAAVPRAVSKIIDSDWLAALRANLKRVDETATFMDKAQHFLVPLQDDFLEVAAWSVRIERMG